MSLTTLLAPINRTLLGRVNIDTEDGKGVVLTDEGIYVLSAPIKWYYAAADNLAVGAMTAVEPGVEVTLTGPVTKYMKGSGLSQVTITWSLVDTITELAAAAAPSGVDGYTGASNTGIGADTAPVLADDQNNTFIGAEAGEHATGAAINSVAIGWRARQGSGTSSGYSNTAVGADSLTSVSTGSENVAIGNHAGSVISTGTRNTVVGTSAAAAMTTGHDNVAVGKGAMAGATLAGNSVAVGAGALAGVLTGDYNTALGFQALAAATGTENTAVGANALGANTTGQRNVGVGTEAGSEVSTGEKNIFIGHHAGVGLGNVSNRLALGSADAPIDTITVPCSNGYGAAFISPMRFYNTVGICVNPAAPADADIAPGNFIAWLDEGADKLKFKVKYSNGVTIKSGEIALV